MDAVFLTDGGQGADVVAQKFADFVSKAQSTLHIAIYDFRLNDNAAQIVFDALNALPNRGVNVRIGYNKPIQHQPHDAAGFAHLGADPAPAGTANFLQELDKRIQTRAIDAHGHLMHSKYILRDGVGAGAALWMGSANFTNDAWSRQENNILLFETSPDAPPQVQALCQYYETDFAELWNTGSITSTGLNDTGDVTIGDSEVTVAFSPGEGRTIEHDIATHIGAAKDKIAIATMVLSSGSILGC